MKKKKNHSSTGMKFFVFGASLAGLAAAYFFLTPKGKKKINDTKSWAIKMKGDVVEKLEEALEISEAVYNKIIDSVAAKYEKNSKASAEEVKELAENLKKQWSAISLSAKNKKADEAKKVSKTIKKK